MSDAVSVTVVPAFPGFSVIYADSTEGELFVCEPVIAWAIKHEVLPNGDVHAVTYPVTSHGTEETHVGILNPDGQVNAWDGLFDTLAAATAHYKEQLQRERGD
jgi:hypothetical protein